MPYLVVLLAVPLQGACAVQTSLRTRHHQGAAMFGSICAGGMLGFMRFMGTESNRPGGKDPLLSPSSPKKAKEAPKKGRVRKAWNKCL